MPGCYPSQQGPLQPPMYRNWSHAGCFHSQLGPWQLHTDSLHGEIPNLSPKPQPWPSQWGIHPLTWSSSSLRALTNPLAHYWMSTLIQFSLLPNYHTWTHREINDKNPTGLGGCPGTCLFWEMSLWHWTYSWDKKTTLVNRYRIQGEIAKYIQKGDGTYQKMPVPSNWPLMST